VISLALAITPLSRPVHGFESRTLSSRAKWRRPKDEFGRQAWRKGWGEDISAGIWLLASDGKPPATDSDKFIVSKMSRKEVTDWTSTKLFQFRDYTVPG
jgi:hypothetical protein